MDSQTKGLLVIFAFTFIPLVLAEIARNRFKYTLEDFFIQSRSMNSFFAFFTLSAVWISAYALLGATRSCSIHGPLYLTSFAWSVLFGLIAYVIGRRVWLLGKEHGYMTASDFFDDIYRNRTLSMTVTAVIAVFTIPYIVIQIQGGAFLIAAATEGKIPYHVAGLVFYLAIIILLWPGGLRTIVMTDVFYVFMIIIAMVFTGAYFVVREGSIENCFNIAAQNVGDEFFTLGDWGAENSPIIWLCLFAIIPIGVFMEPPIWIRTYSIARASTFRYIPLVMAGIAFIYLGPIITGTVGVGISPEEAGTDNLLMLLVKSQMNTVPGILVCCGIAAAAISTANAQIHSLSSVVTIDIFKKHINRQATDRELINTGKRAVLGISTAAYILMLVIRSGIINMGLLSLAGTMQVFVSVVGGLFWTRANSKAATAGIWAGIATIILFALIGINMAIAGMAGFILNTVIFVAGSLILPEDRLAYEKISQGICDYMDAFHKKI